MRTTTLDGVHLPAFPANNMLPHIAQLLNAHWLDQEVDSAMSDPLEHNVCLAIGGHHCRAQPGVKTVQCLTEASLSLLLSRLATRQAEIVVVAVMCGSTQCYDPHC